jgi:hypothetical protein
MRRERSKRWLGRTEFLNPNDSKRAQVGNAQTIHESEMALFYECIQQCARKPIDTADVVIALGKAWKRRNRE